LDLASSYRCNWNYGNATHDANRYLGLISLKAGDQAAASGLSIEIGQEQRIPQLDTLDLI
jgi:hypothetical protein